MFIDVLEKQQACKNAAYSKFCISESHTSSDIEKPSQSLLPLSFCLSVFMIIRYTYFVFTCGLLKGSFEI